MMDLSSDCEKYQDELLDIEARIKDVDPHFDKDFDNEHVILLNKYNNLDKIFFAADLGRSCESLFRPYLLGLDCQGLSETLAHVLAILPQHVQRRLLRSIFLVGGGAGMWGLRQRVQTDLEHRFVHLRPRRVGGGPRLSLTNPHFNRIVELWKPASPTVSESSATREQSLVEVVVPERALELGYSGICKFVRDFDDPSLRRMMISREEYQEHGPSLFKPCIIGNI